MVTTNLDKLSIKKISLTGLRVLVRVDFNVPLDENCQITNDQRIRSSIPTIQYILSKNPKCVILMSHLGRPDGKVVSKMSLKPVAHVLERLLNKPVKFLSNCIGSEVEDACMLADNGQVILLENLRFHLEEEGSISDKSGQKIKADPADIKRFRESLTKLGQIYINDAFGTAHRAHSSMVGINLPDRAAGLLLQKELEFFSKALNHPERPFLAILGGAKVSDKILLIENLLDKVDEMIIGGGMAYTFKHVIDNIEIGDSIFDENGSKIIPKLLEKAKQRNVAIHLPVDHVIADSFHKDARSKTVSDKDGIHTGWKGMDIGPESIGIFEKVVKKCKTIIWNGPMGVFEFDQFANGTHQLLEIVSNHGKMDGNVTTIIGGGDTATAVEKWNFQDHFSHVSTGGGASLELLEGKELPGVSALCDS